MSKAETNTDTLQRAPADEATQTTGRPTPDAGGEPGIAPELVALVAERVYRLWLADMQIERERKR